jgi:hypothetical protein
MKHAVFAVRDTCIGSYNMPMFFQNRAGAVRALGDAVNRPKEDNMYYQHPEHYQLYEVGTFDDDSGMFEPIVPEFVVDCQSLVRS